MSRQQRARGPRLQALALPPLEDAEAADLRAGARLEAVRIEGGAAAGDLGGLVLDDCAVLGLDADGAALDGARILGTRLERIAAARLRAARSTWRDVELAGSRMGAAELFDADWTRVDVSGCRIDYLNLSGATLQDVRFTDCVLGDLDLRASTITRLALPGCRIGTLSIAGATLTDADLRGAELEGVDGAEHLRGAIVDGAQLDRLAPLLAAAIGLVVEG
ncbi:pentapeptide repeat-containing protein [Amnibacterium sp. CER49]|uniref:pentapeptide repeat-containing protein n=1 Tax=Amnibacterium sp. CER49 TaxID=3039161 RepID=UPI0024472C64|nr:pentapeptide repeat-containing protein [Amnibacterium sp. CER49]MDH2444976.1 pentapeptide repeat-containing protein [Amnibacterium sp. CER49]